MATHPAPRFAGPVTAHSASDWRDLVAATLSGVWPILADGTRWILAQIECESGGDPRAESQCGARGLLQLMPETAAELGVADPFDPEENVRAGVRYLRRLYLHLPEVPTHEDRLAWALAAFNGGLGYVNRALLLAREDGEPDWWRWEMGSRHLASRDCWVRRKDGLRLHPDHDQIVTYVARIRAAYERRGA